jgi:antagonist of KipI
MSLRIIRAGVLDTIQDQGRYGRQHQGINPGGAMDRFASRVANILSGNDPSNPVIEMHFPAPVIWFRDASLIAIGGADFDASINGEPIPREHPCLVSRNSILQFNKNLNGARAYLAVHGKPAFEPWLGSYSTNLKAGAGGLNGGPLKRDDEIPWHSGKDLSKFLDGTDRRVLSFSPGSRSASPELLVLPGKEWDMLDEESKDVFLSEEFAISSHSDRMGYQLSGHPLNLKEHIEMVSTGVNFGTVQLLPDGRMIILMADHQTTGGYPRIAHVISAGLPSLAQKRAGEITRFKMTDEENAVGLLRKQQQQLSDLQIACEDRLGMFFK